MNGQERNCFVICPIGEPDSETRRRSDQVFKYIIAPAVETLGYTPLRADKIDKPGLITSQVIQRIVSDELVVADLTDSNPNVFYELALRHAIRKPFIHLIMKGERVPFDVAGTRTIMFDHHDLDSVDTARDEIIAQLKQIEENPNDVESPISVTVDLQNLRQSENPEERSLAEIISIVANVETAIGKLNSKLGAENDVTLESIQSTLESFRKVVDKRLEMSIPFRVGKSSSIPGILLKELIGDLRQEASSPLQIVIIGSILRQNVPGLYEICIELYRMISSGNRQAIKSCIKDIKRLTHLAYRNPVYREIIGWSRDTEEMLLYLNETIRHFDVNIENLSDL